MTINSDWRLTPLHLSCTNINVSVWTCCGGDFNSHFFNSQLPINCTSVRKIFIELIIHNQIMSNN